ncbi:SIS domain-containing protein [uncultured Chloroflexus sp.]|uniref:D-sedoheptulose-7-phosphate isomerase n=1 Tax=uncultured Chloroflexus sp. TaxID=214040 RepID=UPI002605EB83|nr:SIS domain-containing protein [uncultured Chloroflexus sp.]
MNTLTSYFDQIRQTLEQLPQASLQQVADALWAAYKRDATIFVCGNGGSAATASHFVCDLAKWTIKPSVRRVRAIALTDNVPLITAWSNDQSYADVFVEQLKALYRDGDIIVAISGSGNSPNVVRAIEWGNVVGAVTIGLTGFNGGRLHQIAQIGLHINNHVMPQVEDIHSTICHALAVNLGQQIELSLQPAILQTVEVGG